MSKSRRIVPINRAADVDATPWPHDAQAERDLLGAILLDDYGRAFKIATEKLRPDDFFVSQNRLVFWAMNELVRRGDPIHPMGIIEFLESSEKSDADTSAYVSGLPNGIARINPHVELLIRTIKSKSKRRQIASLSAAIEACALGPESGIGDITLHVERLNLLLGPDAQQDSALAIPDMPEAVLDGRLGEICQARLAGLPVAYAWPSIVTVAGTLVPPSSSPSVRTNNYCCSLGPVGTGKSQAVERSVATLGLGKPHLENTLAGSFEGLSERLDVGGDARLLSPDELGHLLTKSKIDGASFPFVLNSAYYKTEFDVTAARGKKAKVNCRLGIIGGIVESKFSELFGAATTGGLYDRFIFGRCPQPFQYDYRPFEGGSEQTDPCDVSIAGDVWELKSTWLKEIPGLSARIAELAIRVAIVAAAFSGRSILYAKAIEKSGRAFAEYQARFRQAFRPNPGENTDAVCAWDIRSWLSEHPGWNRRHTVYRAINAYRFGPAAFERSISAMAAGGEMDVDSGRPTRIRLLEGN